MYYRYLKAFMITVDSLLTKFMIHATSNENLYIA